MLLELLVRNMYIIVVLCMELIESYGFNALLARSKGVKFHCGANSALLYLKSTVCVYCYPQIA